MKDLDKKEVADIAGGVEPQHSESQLAPEPEPQAIVIDYNPDRSPK